MEGEPEDGMFLIIIGDEVSEAKPEQIPAPITIKQEWLDFDKPNVKIDVKIETLSDKDDGFEYEYLEDMFVNNDFSKPSTTENDEDYVPYNETNTSEEEYDMSTVKVRKTSKNKRTKRYSMLKPSQRRSFVEELRQQYSELKDDPDLLIDTLTEIMRDVKPPPLPQEYYVTQSIYFACNKCGSLSETLPAAGRHYQEKHGERYLVCYACGVDFRSTTNLYKHEKRCIAPDAHIVLKARAAFVGRKGRSRPFLSIRPPKPKVTKFPCSSCSAVFLSKNTLVSHEHLHRGERPHRCHVCPAAYTSQSALARHAKIHTDAQFICDKCSKSFKIKAALVSHMDTHNQIRKYECLECDRRFSQKCAMLLHVNRVHRKLPPPCACQICPKRYPRMSLLKAHMKKAHNMVLMTRKMFFKTLPKLTEAQITHAKVALASDAPSLQEILENHRLQQESEMKNEEYCNQNDDDGETYTEEDDEVYNGEEESYKDNSSEDSQDLFQEENDIPMEKIIQYFSRVERETPNETKMIIIQNGQVISQTHSEQELSVFSDTEMENKDDNMSSIKEETDFR